MPLSRLEELAKTAEAFQFEKEWEGALRSGTPVQELVAALAAFAPRENELALLLAETAAEELDSGQQEKALEFTSGVAPLFDSSETIALILAESLRDRHLLFEPLEAFINASGILNPKKSLSGSWARLREYLRFSEGNYILHREFGPGKILRISRSSCTVDFQRSRNHDMSLEALMETTRPIEPDSLFVLRWERPEEFMTLIEGEDESLLRRAYGDMASEGSLTEVNLFKLLEGSDVMPRTMWKALKKAAESSGDFMLMGDSIIPADNTSLVTQVRAVLAMGRTPMSGKTKTINSLVKAAPAQQTKELQVLFDEVTALEDIEKGAVFELAWLCSGKGKIDGFQERTARFIEDKAVRVERAMGEIHSAACRKLYLERFFETSPDRDETAILLDRLPRTLREQAAEHVAKIDPETHAEYLLTALNRPEETEHFMWALERAANLGEFMEPDRIVELALKNLNFARSEMQRRICNVLMDKLRPQLENHISLLDTRRLETLTGNLEESIGAQETGLVLLARRELSGRRTGGFTNIKKYWEGDSIYSSRKAIAELHNETEELQSERIPEVAKQIAEAASHGDLSENAEYTAALEKRDFLLETLNRYRNQLKVLLPYPVGQVTSEIICPPSKVLLESMDGESGIRRVMVVGPLDADAEEGFINYQAPLGAALLGLSKGDTVQLPGEKESNWRVTEIEILEELLQ